MRIATDNQILRAIQQYPGITCRELAERLGYRSHSTVWLRLQRLRAEGFIRTNPIGLKSDIYIDSQLRVWKNIHAWILDDQTR